MEKAKLISINAALAAITATGADIENDFAFEVLAAARQEILDTTKQQ